MAKYNFVVLSGEHERVSVPVRGVLPTKEAFPPVCMLRDEESGKEYVTQTSRRGAKELEVSFIADHLPPRYEMEAMLTDEVPASSHAVPNAVAIADPAGDKIRVDIGGQHFTTYHTSGFSKPFLYPLNSVYGGSVTRSLDEEKKAGETTDHVHHRSVWTAWGDVNGRDYWGEGKGHGLQVLKTNDIIEKGPVCGTFLSQIAWQSQKGEVDITELRKISIYGGLGDGARVIDFTLALTPTGSPAKFGDTKEGGLLSVRVATSLDVPKGGKIQNAIGGIQEEETWGKQAVWCDYSGKVDGNEVGVAIFDHPDNPTFPMYWHVRNYGLMAANPWGLSEFKGKGYNGSITLEKGASLNFKFRLLVHKGDAVTGEVAKHYLNYVIPPKIVTF